jgi:type IX secretion system PorP/SprF family membrane protein
MRNDKYILCFLFSILSGYSLLAQTPYSSQNFTLTNFFNPATVGYSVNSQFKSFFRTQYANIAEPYNSFGMSMDFGLFKKSTEGNNYVGIGIEGLSERVLNGALQTNTISLSIADRLFLNLKKTNYISMGLGASMITRTLDIQQLSFGDQFYSGRLFNGTLEAIANYPVKYASKVGVMYTSHGEKTYLQFGGSLFYINRTANELENSNGLRYYQLMGQLNMEHQFLEDKTFLVHADYQNRFESEFFYFGGAIGMPIYNKNAYENRFYLGCFYRTKDALIPYVGIMYDRYRMGLSYDIYNNNLTKSNLHPQTIELNFSMPLGKRPSDLVLYSLFNN